MGTDTGIEWTDHTFNPWIGCTAVSCACDHCYAETLVKRWGGDFAIRRRTAQANWNMPLRWNKMAEKANVRRRVFCASLADVFDNQVPEGWRWDLFDLISATPMLDWQLLTKRPQNVARMLPLNWGNGWPNVWLGTTCENQTEAERRIPHLIRAPACVRFLSCEPLLGPLRLRKACSFVGRDYSQRPIDWVIAGGESGPGARPMHPEWASDLVQQCAGIIPFFFKQWGDWRPVRPIYDEDDSHIDAIGNADEKKSAVILRTGTIHEDWEGQPPEGAWMMERVGKKRAGALLDGRTHRAFPHA